MNEDDELEIPGDFVERKRKDISNSKDKAKKDALNRKAKASHKNRIRELKEEDLDDDLEDYKHLMK